MRRLLCVAFAAVMLVAVYETGQVQYALYARQLQAQQVDSDALLRERTIQHAVIESALDHPTLSYAVVVDRSRRASAA